ncbi:hypothetical protein BN13_1250005 [Nostocoides jenkinsii Ben 74]|uniref:Uncharacterized protein n=1 Tax=Nostocoides jenkinsii Ben 74 TaxID=1193518 RepID=A0A077M5I3_9MICO|nr:hypothetical protein BN13_1250005 [Tetrasphaera jenkinsii Ben 74]
MSSRRNASVRSLWLGTRPDPGTGGRTTREFGFRRRRPGHPRGRSATRETKGLRLFIGAHNHDPELELTDAKLSESGLQRSRRVFRVGAVGYHQQFDPHDSSIGHPSAGWEPRQ